MNWNEGVHHQQTSTDANEEILKRAYRENGLLKRRRRFW